MSETTASTRPNRRLRFHHKLGIAVGTIGLLAAGCSSDKDTNSATNTNAAPTGSVAVNNTASGSEILLRFNDLDQKADADISVYPGTGNTDADKTAIAGRDFPPDATVVAECRETGRLVVSHPENGDEDRESDQWVRIRFIPGVTMYATMTYADIVPPASLEQLPEC